MPIISDDSTTQGKSTNSPNKTDQTTFKDNFVEDEIAEWIPEAGKYNLRNRLNQSEKGLKRYSKQKLSIKQINSIPLFPFSPLLINTVNKK